MDARERSVALLSVRADLKRWEQKYAGRIPPLKIGPDSSLVRFRNYFNGEGRSLDLACGLADNAMFLAELGYESYAVDISLTALSMAQSRARTHGLRIHTWVADLDVYPLPDRAFDAIVVVRFLNRSLIRQFQTTLRPGGILFYKTFNTNFLRERPDFPPAYVLAPGELSGLFETWRCIETNDDANNVESHSYWFGQLT